MRDIGKMRTFLPVPNPKTTPRIQSNKEIEKIKGDYQAFMFLFWDFFNELRLWRENVETRLEKIERKLPHSS